MTKTELIEGLANKLGMHKSEAEKAINIILDDITAALRQGDRVNISGFGTFSVSAHRAQPQDRRGYSDFRQPLGQIQGRQAAQGLA
jgi:nucleoid DNA-binding protein